MSKQIEHITELATAFGGHLNISHWAVSMRLVGKGNFIKRLKDGGDTHTKTAAKVICWFDENWPDDLEWPADIPRPSSNEPDSDAA